MLILEAHFESLHGILKQKRYWGFHPIHWGLSCVCPSCNFPVGGPLMAVSKRPGCVVEVFDDLLMVALAGHQHEIGAEAWHQWGDQRIHVELLIRVQLKCHVAMLYTIGWCWCLRMVSQILSAEFDSMSFSRSLEGFWKLCNQDYQHGGPDFWQWKCKVYSPLLEHHRYHTLVYVVELWELWGWSHPWICEVCTS